MDVQVGTQATEKAAFPAHSKQGSGTANQFVSPWKLAHIPGMADPIADLLAELQVKDDPTLYMREKDIKKSLFSMLAKKKRLAATGEAFWDFIVEEMFRAHVQAQNRNPVVWQYLAKMEMAFLTDLFAALRRKFTGDEVNHGEWVILAFMFDDTTDTNLNDALAKCEGDSDFPQLFAVRSAALNDYLRFPSKVTASFKKKLKAHLEHDAVRNQAVRVVTDVPAAMGYCLGAMDGSLLVSLAMDGEEDAVKAFLAVVKTFEKGDGDVNRFFDLEGLRNFAIVAEGEALDELTTAIEKLEPLYENR
jgi:hypothetical protein